MKTWHWLALAGLTIASIGFEVFGPENEHSYPWNIMPGVPAIFGFVGCILIIVVSKALGKRWLQKREDYYDD